MSFFRHRKIYQSDEPKGGRAYRSASLATIVPMSLQPAIPSWVALQQSPCPLRRFFTASLSDLLLYSFRQRTLTCPYFPCLNTGVHSRVSLIRCPHPAIRGSERLSRRVDRGGDLIRIVRIFEPMRGAAAWLEIARLSFDARSFCTSRHERGSPPCGGSGEN